MRLAFSNSKVKFFIGDVRNYESVYEVMNGVNFVFHAAALKQVPSCEFYLMEAVRTNIIGAENVMKAALERKVEKVVFQVPTRQSIQKRNGYVKSDDGTDNGS